MDIACASDDHYLPHCATMLQSLVAHNPSTKFTLHFMHGAALNPQGKEKLSKHLHNLNIKTNWITIADEQVNQLPTQGYLSKVVWYRILMPELLHKVDRVLFLDCDLIVNDDIALLWETNVDHQYFAAVTNVVEKRFANRAQALGLEGPHQYFNAGVALWNLKQMRAEKFSEAVIQYAQKNAAKLLWLEQDAMNALFSARRVHLHPRWNVQNGIIYKAWGCRCLNKEELEKALSKPAIFHFEGGEAGKPWHLLCTHPHKKLYLKYRRQTPWPFFIPDGLSLRNFVEYTLPTRFYNWVKTTIKALQG